MNLSEPLSVDTKIADVQNSVDTRNLKIDKVGVKELRHPVQIIDRRGLQSQHLICMWNYLITLKVPTCHVLLRS